ncbi:MAG: FG-GAP-like repeat-containing protein, partial [Nitrospinota bacterium]
MALLQQDRLNEAAEQFRELKDLAPQEPAGYANLALVHLRRGELGEAERWAKEALGRAPEDPDLRLLLARIQEESGRRAEAREELERALAADPEHLKVLYALAEWEGERRDYLRRIVGIASGNLAARLQLVTSLLRAGEADSAAAQLEEFRSIAAELPEGAVEEFNRALARARAGDAQGARLPFSRFRELVVTTGPYQAALQQLEGPRREASGFLNLAFSYELTLQVPVEKDVLEALRFADGTTFAGLDVVAEGAGKSADGTPVGETWVAAGDVDGDGDADLFAWTGTDARGSGRGFLLRNDLGRFVDTSPDVLKRVGAVTGATWGDYDGDGRMDLYVVRDGPNHRFRNRGDGRLEDVTEAAGVADVGSGRAAL